MREIKQNRKIDVIIYLWISIALLAGLTTFTYKNHNKGFSYQESASDGMVVISLLVLIPMVIKIIRQIGRLKDKVNKSKTLIVLIFIFVSFAIPAINKLQSESLAWYEIDFKYWLWAYVISFVIAYLMHFFMYLIILNNYSLKPNLEKNYYIKTKQKKIRFYFKSFLDFKHDTEGSTGTEKKIEYIMNFLFRLLTPDYSYATNFKVLLMNKNLNKSYLKSAEITVDSIGKRLRSRKTFEKTVYST